MSARGMQRMLRAGSSPREIDGGGQGRITRRGYLPASSTGNEAGGHFGSYVHCPAVERKGGMARD
ncbi:MAG: hypothetical protein HY708_04740 [Ignavibacteriae bacterium]|nr:hypothetical protein [Ignavibacteriota bacterium]